MAVDYLVMLDCRPKQHFGNGDAGRGALDILERLKARNRARAVREMSRQQGLSEANPSVTVQTLDENGQAVEQTISVAEMEAEARPLDEHAAACAGCPANFLSKPYGCVGVINYPVRQADESWLLSRVQPAGTIGAQLCDEFMTEFRVTGESIGQLRERGLYEARKAGKVALTKGFLRGKSLSADQLLETVFMAGESLDPGHCFGILIWLGAISVDGTVPAGGDDRATLQTLLGLCSVAERQKHTKLELGSKASGESMAAFQSLVTALYLCWVHDVPLYISS